MMWRLCKSDNTHSSGGSTTLTIVIEYPNICIIPIASTTLNHAQTAAAKVARTDRTIRTSMINEHTSAMGMARRLARLVLLQPTLDANYRRAAAHAYAWPKSAEA